VKPADRQPIIVADAGPLIRLAAAGLLGSMRGLNRHIVLVDRVADEVAGDPTKPFARDISEWIASLGDAVEHVRTVVGEGVESLRRKTRNADDEALLKSALRNSGEQAIREFVERWSPQGEGSALVLYEDRKLPMLFLDVDFTVDFMTTRAFARRMQQWGINVDAPEKLEAVAAQYDLKPALSGRFEAETPPDLRQLPQAMEGQ
jgi:hypothetical protein